LKNVVVVAIASRHERPDRLFRYESIVPKGRATGTVIVFNERSNTLT